MSKKTVKATPTNTSATANPGTAADVSATEEALASSQAIMPAADEGTKPDRGNQGNSPSAGAAAELAIDLSQSLEFTHRIHGKAAKGFYRAGRFWPRDGIDINRASFTDEQWTVLTDEPQLSVVTL